jgi:multiple sugar transport system ATP-binding protein
VTEAAEVLGIRELLKRKPKELSGGQRQRVAMGRAIVRKPQAFLFDEPLSNLDAKLRVQMRAELSKLHERLQTTIVYVTHDQVEAMTLANRIIIMNEGRIMQAGKPLGVYENPKNKFVAGFIGSPSMNFIDTKLVEDGGRLYVDAESFCLVIPRDLESRYRDHVNSEVVFGIRPEHINDSFFVDDIHGRDEIKVLVDVIEPIGSEVILIVTIGKHRMTAKVDPRTKAIVNQLITLNIDMKKMHIFNKKTGEVIY